MIGTTSVLLVVGVTLLAFFVSAFSYGEAHLKHIKENWVQYRCNPLYMPLADLVGSDILSNFMGCTMSAFQSYAGYAMDPVYSMFGLIGGILTDIQGTLDDFRDMISGTKSAFLAIISDTYGKLTNTFSSVTRLVARMRTLSNRMLAMFVTVFHMVTTGVQTGESVANGPIGQAAQFFCFGPYTRVRLDDGTSKALPDVVPGDVLRGGAIVESVLSFDGQDVPMCRLGDILVSGNHKVLFRGRWIRVEMHPYAEPMETRFKTLWCLNTSTNTIPIDRLVFKDYEETKNPEILRKFEGIVESLHNRTALPANAKRRRDPLAYRHSGALAQSSVRMADSSLKPLSQIRIGDEIAKGGKVLGIVRHQTMKEPVVTPTGTLVSKGTWILDAKTDSIYTADSIGERTFVDPGLHLPCMNLLTENGYVPLATGTGLDTIILDDQETTEDWVHSWRDIAVQKETEV